MAQIERRVWGSQAIAAGAAFRSLTERHNHVEIKEVRRQHERWQQQATREFSAGRAGEALDAYRDHGMVYSAESATGRVPI